MKMSDIEKNKPHKDDQWLAIKEFIGPQADYYKTQFEKIGSSSGFTPTFNWAAALLGSIWFASRVVGFNMVCKPRSLELGFSFYDM